MNDKPYCLEHLHRVQREAVVARVAYFRYLHRMETARLLRLINPALSDDEQAREIKRIVGGIYARNA